MRVVLTGASGFIGSSLGRCLSAHGVLWSALGRSQVLDAIPIPAQIAIHLAGRAHVMRDCAADPLAAFRDVNVRATLELATQAAASGVRRFVFMSSIKVNGEATTINHPFTEQDTPAPQDAYAISKWEAEQGLHEIAANTGMEVVIIRAPLVYGPGVKANFAALMRVVQRGVPLPLAAVNNMRSLVALDNLVDFIVTCTTHPAAAQQTFLVSDGYDMSTPQLIRAMAHAAGMPARLLPVPHGVLAGLARLVDKRAALERLCGSLQVDIAKARRVLQWVPPVGVEEALQRTFAGGRK